MKTRAATRTITLDGQPIEVPLALAEWADRQTEAVGTLGSRVAELEGLTSPREVKLGVIEFHEQPELREYFYRVVKDLTDAGCIVDLWLMDLQSVLKTHGYTMTIHDDGTHQRPKRVV